MPLSVSSQTGILRKRFINLVCLSYTIILRLNYAIIYYLSPIRVGTVVPHKSYLPVT